MSKPVLTKACNLLAWSKQVTEWAQGQIDDTTAYVVSYASPTNFYGIVTQCQRTTGFAKVRVAAGTIGSLSVIDAGSTEIIVFMGINSHIRVGDEVLCVSNGTGITPSWTAFKPIPGIIWSEPSSGLCDDQDNGGGETGCTDTVGAS